MQSNRFHGKWSTTILISIDDTSASNFLAARKAVTASQVDSCNTQRFSCFSASQCVRNKTSTCWDWKGENEVNKWSSLRTSYWKYNMYTLEKKYFDSNYNTYVFETIGFWDRRSLRTRKKIDCIQHFVFESLTVSSSPCRNYKQANVPSFIPLIRFWIEKFTFFWVHSICTIL